MTPAESWRRREDNPFRHGHEPEEQERSRSHHIKRERQQGGLPAAIPQSKPPEPDRAKATERTWNNMDVWWHEKSSTCTTHPWVRSPKTSLAINKQVRKRIPARDTSDKEPDLCRSASSPPRPSTQPGTQKASNSFPES